MCGIAGFIGSDLPEEKCFRDTLRKMRNRGPDRQSFTTFQEGSTHIGLLHSRLSIIDLEERSHQPFTSGDCTLVFNGEIYNYLELRTELEKQGVRFRTQSDTEVLLQSYLRKGESCVEDFEGMWAFAIYDRKRKRLFLSRDRFAEKPLYYYQTPQGFYFGSEVKFLESLAAIRFDVNERQMMRYLVHGFRSLYKFGETFFQQVREVPYATNVFIDLDLHIVFKRYWQNTFELQPMSFEQAVEGFRERLFESVKLRLRADTPLAFCLSGGVDSSALVSIAVKRFGHNAAVFSILDNDERYNEVENIQATVEDLGCKSTLISLQRENTLTRLRELIKYHDAPVYTISYYIHSLISEAISKQGCRVALMGTGADEMVTGYYDHFNLHLAEIASQPEVAKRRSEWEELIRPMVRNPWLQDPALFIKNPNFRGYIYLGSNEFADLLKKDFREEFIEETFTSSCLRNRTLNELFCEIVPVILHEDDINSMYYSIENRSPYLDSRLFKFAYSIPPRHLIREGYGKIILREAVKGILNDKVRLDRHKKGFNASILSLVDFNDKANREYLLDDSPIFDLVERSKIEMMLHRKEIPNSLSKFLFYFISAKMFLEARKKAIYVTPN